MSMSSLGSARPPSPSAQMDPRGAIGTTVRHGPQKGPAAAPHLGGTAPTLGPAAARVRRGSTASTASRRARRASHLDTSLKAGGAAGADKGPAQGVSSTEQAKRVQELEDMLGDVTREREELVRLRTENDKEIGLLKTELGEVKARNHHMLERLDRVERLENSIISLYLEVKDRSADDPDVEPDLQQQRDELKKINSLVVLDYMRASLRTLLAFKEDYESELRGKLQLKKAENEAQLEELQAKFSRVENELRLAQESEQDATKRMRASEARAARLSDESKGLFEKVDKDNKRLVDLVREKEDELEDIRRLLVERDQTIKHKDIRLMRISQLESQIQANKVQHQFDLQKLQAQHNNQLKALERDIHKHSKAETTNRQLEKKVDSLEQELASYKHHLTAVRVREAEDQAAKAKDLIQRLRTELDSTKLELRRTQQVAEQHMRKNKDLKEEYDKLFDRVNREKMRRRAQENKPDYKKLAEGNPSYIAVYKDRLKEKERECSSLQNKIRKLLAAEHHKTLMEKSFEIERARYQTELAELKMRQAVEDQSAAATGATQLPAAVPGRRSRPAKGARPVSAVARSPAAGPTTPSSLFSAGPQDTEMDDAEAAEQVAVLKTRNNYLESQLRDFENLKSISVATARAYERLLDKTASGDTVVVEETMTELEKEANRILTPAAGTPTSVAPDSVRSETQLSLPPKARSRPSSASQHGRPNIGGARSTLRVGSLLGA